MHVLSEPTSSSSGAQMSTPAGCQRRCSVFPLPRAYRAARNSKWFWPCSEKTCRLSLAPRKTSEASGRRGRSHYPLLLRQFLTSHTSRGEPSRNFRYRADPTDISGGMTSLGQSRECRRFRAGSASIQQAAIYWTDLYVALVPEVAIQSLASERLKSTRSRGSTSECAIRTPDLADIREPAPVSTFQGTGARDPFRACSARYHFCPISRLLDGGLRHTYENALKRGANSAVARLRRSRPTRGGAVWESGERREAGGPDIDAKLVCRRGVGASCGDHEEVRPWRSNALHSEPSRLTERPMNTT